MTLSFFEEDLFSGGFFFICKEKEPRIIHQGAFLRL